MKKIWLILGLALFSFMMTACEKFDPEDPDSFFEQFIHRKLPRSLPEHWFYEDDSYDGLFGYRANSVSIYFLDEQGNNFIDLGDKSTWPVPCFKDEYVADPGSYYDDFDFKAIDSNTTNPYYRLYVPVNGQHIMTYPLRFRGRDYEMKFEFLYTNDDIFGSKSMYAYIFRWKIEDYFIYSDFENPAKKDIIVTLDKDGDIVSVQRKERVNN